jgi:hypothetical protein
MDDSERKAIEKLHRECTVALEKYLKEGTEMCRLLSAIESHPATTEERRLLLQQRIKENKAHNAYDSVREALFKMAGWY